ncbi:MAG: C_GCAxxG_C_C family protein [Desulfuromonadales bacterium]|nr:C_GCAxxG_C_C family protein [Desulfuromonadales bacterium]
MHLYLRRLFQEKKQRQGTPAGELAGHHFTLGRNCCESVLLAHHDDIDPAIIEMAKAFGGGIGGSKCLCGAITGGVMALSLHGQRKDAAKLVELFKGRNKVTCCKALSAPYTWKSKEHLANCRRLTSEVAEDVEKLLKR